MPNPLLDLLSGIGNVLDTPGSVVRGLLSGDADRAFGGILDPSRRVSGRDMLDKWGVTNNDSGTLGDIGGFAAQVATDPLTWLGGTLARTILGRSGRASEAAGAISAPKPIGSSSTLLDAAPGVGGYKRLADGTIIRTEPLAAESTLGIGAGGEKTFAAGSKPLTEQEAWVGQKLADWEKPITDAEREQYRKAIDRYASYANNKDLRSGTTASSALKSELSGPTEFGTKANVVSREQEIERLGELEEAGNWRDLTGAERSEYGRLADKHYLSRPEDLEFNEAGHVTGISDPSNLSESELSKGLRGKRQNFTIIKDWNSEGGRFVGGKYGPPSEAFYNPSREEEVKGALENLVGFRNQGLNVGRKYGGAFDSPTKVGAVFPEAGENVRLVRRHETMHGLINEAAETGDTSGLGWIASLAAKTRGSNSPTMQAISKLLEETATNAVGSGRAGGAGGSGLLNQIQGIMEFLQKPPAYYAQQAFQKSPLAAEIYHSSAIPRVALGAGGAGAAALLSALGAGSQ